MAYTTIDDGSAHFQTALWTGDGNSTQAITNNGNSNLQPDLVWLKRRNGTENHTLADTTRGVTKRISSNTTGAEDTNGIASVQSDGFTVSSSYNGNANGSTYVGWQWKANGGTTASNSNGTITSTVQANTAAGFSIISYTGNGSDGATIGHGLNATPEVFFPKCLSTTTNWEMYFFPPGGTKQYGYLNLTNGFSTWSHTAPTTTTIGLSGSGDSNGNGRTMIGYAFHSVKGYSKIGTYIGNGSTSGNFINTGFKPAFVLTKQTTTASDTYQWGIRDSVRTPGNPANKALYPNGGNAENDHGTNNMYFNSNGFMPSTANSHTNGNGMGYFYMAFAESPFVSSAGVPTTAR
tara:strand:- start:36 stop:1082 length:1047 start_codon:yes stop_codon:yes gene_type:complete